MPTKPHTSTWLSGLAVLTLLAGGCESPYAAPSEDPGTPPPGTAGGSPAGAAAAALGEGFVVWESNRTGDWRVWIRGLEDGEPRQLTPAEGDRQHCCPHVAPGGEAVAYLSLRKGQELYPRSGATGPLHLIRRDGTGDRVLVDEASTYFEHRAVVWHSDDDLVYIGGDRRTRLLKVSSGETRLLTEEVPTDPSERGWLVNRAFTHATAGKPSFSLYDAGNRRVDARPLLGGCQPYFSYDGRWGFWIAGAGGPIRAMDLATRRTSTVLGKSDPRLPPGQGYLYFPMLSHDGRLLAFGASRDRHSHHTEDYDVFVAETDPRTLAILGRAVRITAHSATDRFPDVYSAPLKLGRHFGEAPFRIELEPPGDGWRFFAGGTEIGDGASLRHTFEAGTYALEARRGDEVLHGMATVAAARPPVVEDVALRGGRRLIVRFDEEVTAAGARVAFASGRPLSFRLSDDARSLAVELGAELSEPDVLRLAGFRDRAQVPNEMPETSLDVVPPAWPSDHRGLVFLWESGDGANQVEDPLTGVSRSAVLTPHGRAWLDRDQALELRGGFFQVDGDSMKGLLEGCRATSEITVEAFLIPARRQPGAGRILTFSSGERDRNFTLGQEEDRLVFRLRTSSTGKNAMRPQIDVATLTVGRPVHVAVSYTPGRLTAYVDGEQVLETDVVQSGFFHWKPRALQFGNESREVPRPWHGTVEGVAVYNRFLDAEEAAENARRYAGQVAERAAVRSLALRASLVRRAEIPTLQEIAPYRDALAVFEYRVERVLGGTYDEATIRVVHRVLADGERLPAAERARGTSYELFVEPFFAQPQLESLYLSDLGNEDTPLFYSGEIEP